ncbi:hypothetical protein SSM1_073 [Synechococcus phage S-SM1]|uniref:Uncharacterized protein n=1 Tax=Synechococcus phage S-SM1 TaxID=444859 RepID=E3SI80_9CAUD|nr:hypothetical protein SSM1_073 [Synechococcus phage S-SM1]ADO97277.1 hypothetical protein SSM1_073 [Synechococcus phage S-SM1]
MTSLICSASAMKLVSNSMSPGLTLSDGKTYVM